MIMQSIYEIKKNRLHHLRNKFTEFICQCNKATKDSHLFYRAINKDWLTAAENIKTRLNRNLAEFTYHLQQFKYLADSDEIKLPKFSDVFAELSQIEQDFGEFRFDLNEKTISVITDPIILNDIHFGAFEIRLCIEQISQLYCESPYIIIALEPNCAGPDDSVTHPHVRSEKLCEGDGHISIRKALEQGRLSDFFTMVISILQTYNPDSPYVSLDEWTGIPCYDCDCIIGGDDHYFCEYCSQDFCPQCSTYCRICDLTICLGCSYECPSCNEYACPDCITKCKDCEETFCKDCLTEEGLCQNCEDNRKENDNDQSKPNKTETCIAIQPNSMGQVNIHA